MAKLIKSTIRLFAALFVTLTAICVGCSDDPGVENYYTAKGEMASTYLTNRSETYSEFIEIIKRSNTVSFELLGTYGSFTVFAPTNEAIDRYLAGRGFSSVDELTTEDCDTIAATHIIEQSFFTTDFSNATLPVQNMLDRYLTITCDSDSVSMPDAINIVYYINSDARLVSYDDSVENGVVHTLDRIIDATTDMLPDLLKEDSTISLFYEALKLTHLDDSMRNYMYDDYHCSPDSFEEGHCFPTAVEADNVFYMEHRYYGYTGFIEKDEVYAQHGINNIDDLKAYAKQVYDDMYPECADIDDPTDRRNSLNRFVAYHFLDRRAHYDDLTVKTAGLRCFDRRHWDIADWYETMAPYSLMKISYPSGIQAGRYVNRRGVQNRKDARGVFVPGAMILSPSDAGRNQEAVNGVYHYITDIITYGRETQEVVLNERMRIDASTLSPDFMTSGARGHMVGQFGVGGIGGCPEFPYQYGLQSTSMDPKQNVNTCLGFKEGSARYFEFSDVTTHLHVRNRYLNFWSYQGDEVTICGMYDVKFKLPPVPEGDYEFRIATCIDFSNRGIVQVYLDGEPCGIPLDMRIAGTHPSVGFRADSEFSGGTDQEAIAAYDKAMHNRGWMKGPSSYGDIGQDGTGKPQYFRDHPRTLRRVFATFHSDGRSEHWVRVQQKLESTNGTFAFDYIELCPRSVYNNEMYPEDKL